MSEIDFVRKYLKENKYLLEVKDGKRVYGNRTIARIILKEPDAPKISLDVMRDRVRDVFGLRGESKRNSVKDPEKRIFFDVGKWHESWTDVGNEIWRTPFQIPKFDKLAVFGDVHSQYASKDGLIKFFKSTEKISAVLLNGDLVDSKAMTRHIKLGRVMDYEDELEMSYQLLKGLKEEFDHVYFKEGNHDWWLERFIAMKAPEFGKVRGFTLREMLKLGELGVHHIHNLQPIRYGDLDIIHGHEFPMGASVPNRPSLTYLKRWMRYKKTSCKLLVSHVHTDDHGIIKEYDGQYGEAWTLPAMCVKGAEYAPFTGASIGHGEVIETDKGMTVNTFVYDQSNS